jgi:acyl carrier protein
MQDVQKNITGRSVHMVFEKLKEIILDQLDVDEDEITMDADFVDDLQADSLDITLLMKTISEEFDIAVEDDAVDKISTVGDAVEFIEGYINE